MENQKLIKLLSEIEVKYNLLNDYVKYHNDTDEWEYIQSIKELYPNEINKIWGSNGVWNQGHNAGVLSAIRYVLEVLEKDNKPHSQIFP